MHKTFKHIYVILSNAYDCYDCRASDVIFANTTLPDLLKSVHCLNVHSVCAYIHMYLYTMCIHYSSYCAVICIGIFVV